MINRLDENSPEYLETAKSLLGHPLFSARLASGIRNRGADRAVSALLREFLLKNRKFEQCPFELSLDEQLARFRRANDEEGWGFSEDDLARLRETAPEWPRGGLSVRSLRIRFGEGDAGVEQTYEAHIARIKTVFGDRNFSRGEKLGNDEPIRLIAGNDTHKPCLEWITTDLGANRNRSWAAVRGPKSLADELLVIAWMFPELIRLIDCDGVPGLCAGGYELSIPEELRDLWLGFVIVSFDPLSDSINLYAHWRAHGRKHYAVPRAA